MTLERLWLAAWVDGLDRINSQPTPGRQTPQDSPAESGGTGVAPAQSGDVLDGLWWRDA